MNPASRRVILALTFSFLLGLLAACGNLRTAQPQVGSPSTAVDLLDSNLLQGDLFVNRIGPDSRIDLAEFGASQALPTGKDGPLAKVGNQLAALYLRTTSDFGTAALSVGPRAVTIEAVPVGGDAAGLLADLEALGLESGATFGNLVSGRLPVAAIADAASLSSLHTMRPSYAVTDVGSVDGQAIAALRADVLREDRLDLDGSGITVGVLSDSFDRVDDCGNTAGLGIVETGGSLLVSDYAEDIVTGDLPAGINVLDDSADCSLIDEGRAMAQLIYDVAPGVDLQFHTAFTGQAAFAQGILDLADAGSDVIVDDIIYLAEPMFQDGIIAQAVDEVARRGVPYFSSAGNRALQSYESQFRPSGVNEPFFGGELHDFDPGPGVQTCQLVTLVGGSIFPILQWDDPFASNSPNSPGADSDLDLFITDGNCNPLGLQLASTFQNIGGDPVEGVSVGGSGSIGIAISLYAGPVPEIIKYVDFGSIADGNRFDPPRFAPTSYGHNNAAGGAGVAAAGFNTTPAFGVNPPEPESFTSVGGIPKLFDVDGNRLPEPEVRNQPRFTAPDGTNTTFFFSDSVRDDDDGDGVFESREPGEFPNFFGTSAAAPHAAAVAAILLGEYDDLNPRQVYVALERSAVNMLTPGYDFTTGTGLVDAVGAFEFAGRLSRGPGGNPSNPGGGRPDR